MDQRRQLREAVWDEPGWAEVPLNIILIVFLHFYVMMFKI